MKQFVFILFFSIGEITPTPILVVHIPLAFWIFFSIKFHYLDI